MHVNLDRMKKYERCSTSPWNETLHSMIFSCHCQQNHTKEPLIYPLEEYLAKHSAAGTQAKNLNVRDKRAIGSQKDQ